MAILTDGSSQSIIWQNFLGSGSYDTSPVIIYWFYQTSYSDCQIYTFYTPGDSSKQQFFVRLNHVSNGSIEFLAHWSTTDGIWQNNAGLATTNAIHCLIITYDSGATTNDPVFFLDGASIAVTETSTPVGTWVIGTGSNLYACGLPTGNSLIGTTHQVSNLIRGDVDESKAAAIWSERNLNSRHVLGVNPFLNGASGLQAFDGATLASTNFIRRRHATVYLTYGSGVPDGNPVGAGETIMRGI